MNCDPFNEKYILGHTRTKIPSGTKIRTCCVFILCGKFTSVISPCGSLTIIKQRSSEGRGRVSRVGSESLFRLRSSERNTRTDASLGGGA